MQNLWSLRALMWGHWADFNVYQRAWIMNFIVCAFDYRPLRQRLVGPVELNLWFADLVNLSFDPQWRKARLSLHESHSRAIIDLIWFIHQKSPNHQLKLSFAEAHKSFTTFSAHLCFTKLIFRQVKFDICQQIFPSWKLTAQIHVACLSSFRPLCADFLGV